MVMGMVPMITTLVGVALSPCDVVFRILDQFLLISRTQEPQIEMKTFIWEEVEAAKGNNG